MSTVAELRELLADLPDDMLVVLSQDGEGNGFSPQDGYSIGEYKPDSTYSGEFTSEGNYKEPDWSGKRVKHKTNAICLWPTN